MIYVGIDVAKGKHDCFIMSSKCDVLHDVFTIHNNMDGFDYLLSKICSASGDLEKVKVGLEATGHDLIGIREKKLLHFIDLAIIHYGIHLQQKCVKQVPILRLCRIYWGMRMQKLTMDIYAEKECLIS